MRKIMMIEDNEDHALLIKRGLEAPDCSVDHCINGLEALKIFQQVKNFDSRPNLILLDVQLPGMSGFDILKEIKKMAPLSHVPVIMLTTSARREEIERAYQFGASGYVVKSDDFPALIKKLTSIKEYWFSVVESPYQFVSPARKS